MRQNQRTATGAYIEQSAPEGILSPARDVFLDISDEIIKNTTRLPKFFIVENRLDVLGQVVIGF